MKPQKTLLVVIRSTILWMIVAVTTPFAPIISLLLYFASPRVRHKAVTYSWCLMYTMAARYICGVKYVVHGRENIAAAPTPGILASNHQSTWETLGFSIIFPAHVWVLKKEILKIPFFGWALGMSSPIAIDRSAHLGSLQLVLDQSADRLAKGFWILIFPEGTRVLPGEEKRYKSGVAKIAIDCKVPIMPIAHDAGHYVPRKSLLFYPGTIQVVVGKPIYVLENETPDELTERVQTAIATDLKKINLLKQARRDQILY